MARTNLTSLGINTIGKNDADIEAQVFRYSPITELERDAIVNPVNGMKIYNSTTNLIDGYIDGEWPAPLCALATLLVTDNFKVTVVITDQSALITSINSGDGNGVVRATNTAMEIGSQIFSAEIVIDEPSILESGEGQYEIRLNTTGGQSGATLRLEPNTNSGDAVIRDAITGTILESGKTFVYPLTMRSSANVSGAFYSILDDNGQALSGTFSVGASITDTLFWAMLAIPRAPSGSVNMTLNAGGSTPNIPLPDGYVTWCNTSFCPPLSLSTVVFVGTQTTSIVTLPSNVSQITGTNLTPSTGNNVVAFSSNNFTSSSDVVHIEGQFKSQVGTGNMLGIGYSDVDPFVSFANSVTGVVAVPSSGLLFDANTGSPLETSQTMNADYAFSIDLDTSNSTSAYKDSLGNSGSLNVKIAYNNANPVFMTGLANSGDTLNDSIIMELNAGATTDLLPTIGAVSPCQAS